MFKTNNKCTMPKYIFDVSCALFRHMTASKLEIKTVTLFNFSRMYYIIIYFNQI